MKMTLKGAALAGACLVAGSAWSANLVADGGFENPVGNNPFQTFGVGAMGAWNVDSGSVDLIRNYWQPASGDQSLDLAGNEPGAISQTIACQQGVTYRVSMMVSGNPDGGPDTKLGEVYYGGSYVGTAWYVMSSMGNTKPDMRWVYEYGYFTAGVSNGKLEIREASGGPGYYGIALDDVSVEAVPEPASMAILGLGALALIRRKK